MDSASIESPIESLMVSPMIRTHQVVECRINLTKGTFTLLKTNYIYLDPNDLVQHCVSSALLDIPLYHWKQTFSSLQHIATHKVSAVLYQEKCGKHSAAMVDVLFPIK